MNKKLWLSELIENAIGQVIRKKPTERFGTNPEESTSSKAKPMKSIAVLDSGYSMSEQF